MIKDILNANENITAATATENKLKAALPQCFDKDGNFCLEKLQELLKKDVSADENYELNFLGKSYGRLLQAMETDTVITPDEEHNSLPQNANSENLYITGDNLDALKHLLKSYENKIKCIYIDPPYNTGSDGFVYNDRFSFTKETLMQKLSVSEEKAERILELTTRGSASHSAWLTFMYPRLLLARDLLTDDGVIFISIDDNEQANLKLLCDDVFGEQNFVAPFIWTKTATPPSLSNKCRKTVEYVLCYEKLLDNTKYFGSLLEGADAPLLNTGNLIKELIFPIGSVRFNFIQNGKVSKGIYEKAELLDDIIVCNGVNQNEFKMKAEFKWGQTMLNTEVANGTYFVIKTNKLSIRFQRAFDESSFKTPNNFLNLELNKDIGIGTNESAVKELESLELFQCFDFPKPISLVKYLINMITKFNKETYILDFFSGSATTAHAVMQLNAEDGGNRKFILVQLPEATKADSEARHAGYETIDQIGRERIKRAAAKIKEEHPDTTADLGFKHFRLNQLNSMQLSQIETFSLELNLVGSDDLLQNFGTQTVLATWLNRDGYGLNPAVKAEKLADYTSYICGSHIYLLENGFDNKALMELCRKYEEDAAFATITNIVVFGYSFSYTELQALQDNVKKFSVTRNSRINVEIRY